MSSEQHRIDGTLECREATDSPGRLVGTILPVGRVAGDRLESSIHAMCGVPPALLAVRGTGTSMREAFRQLLHGTLRPLGALLVEELQAKLDPEAELDFTALRAGDITGSARAFGSLTKAGLTPQSAAGIVGFDDVEVRVPEVSA